MRCDDDRIRSTRVSGRMRSGSRAPTSRTWTRPECGRGLLMARGSSEAIAAWIRLAISGAIGRYGEATAAHAETALITASREHEKRPIRSSRAAHADKEQEPAVRP